MRLICPNCDAHYEVDADLIPPEGRDVQCSDCGHVWFQEGVGAVVIADPPPAPMPRPQAENPQAVPQEAPIAASRAPEPAVADLPGGDEEVGGDDDAEGDDEALRPLAQRSMDETLLAVLREEAEREARARARDAGGPVETQPDLGLTETDAAPRRRIVVRAPSAKPDTPPGDSLAEDPEALTAAPDEDAPRPSRRELLPDIEQINSTLRASGEPRRAGADEVLLPEPLHKRRKGFRLGFLTVVLIAALVAALYSAAPMIKAAMPGLGPMLDSYVTQIDALRHELDRVLHSLLQKLEQGSGG